MTPTPEQEMIINSDDASAMIVAAPGSGKTATIIETVAQAIERRDFMPEEIAVVTFTRSAAGEMVRRLTARNAAGVTATTFHGLLYGVIQNHGAAIGFDVARPILVIDDLTLDTIATHVEQDCRLRDMRGRTAGRWSGTDRKAALSPMKIYECFRTIAADHDLWMTADDRSRMAFRFAKQLIALNMVTLDTMMAFGLLTLQAKPEALGNIRFLIVDESQDCDTLQLHLCDYLARTRGVRLRMIGDPRQSIYEWRGAVPGASIAGKRYGLSQTFRCGAPMITVADAIGDVGVDCPTITPAPHETRIVRHTADSSRDHVRLSIDLAGSCRGFAPQSSIAIVTSTNAEAGRLRQQAFDLSVANLITLQSRRVARYTTLCHWLTSAMMTPQQRALSGLGIIKAVPQITTTTTLRQIALDGEAPPGLGEAMNEFGDDCTIAQFLLERREMMNADTIAPQDFAGATIISTIHGVKGLEFDTVIIHVDEDTAEKFVRSAEGRRLLFVAMTRARHGLIISETKTTRAQMNALLLHSWRNDRCLDNESGDPSHATPSNTGTGSSSE